MFALATLLFASGAQANHDNDVTMAAALNYLRGRQNEDGSFGKTQPRLQTGVAMLAIASIGISAGDEATQKSDTLLLSRAADFLVGGASIAGDMGDDSFRTESHAIATAALICCVERLPDARRRLAAGKEIARAILLLRQNQDRSSSSAAHGGWKMEGRAGSNNDRRASAWALYALTAAKQVGLDVRQNDLERGAKYLLGSFKADPKPAADRDSAEVKPQDIGGLSVDETGLTVETISAMGGWALTRASPNADRARKNLAWLTRNPPAWTGPNYFYANFFRARAVRMLDAGAQTKGDIFTLTMERISRHIKDHQLGDGAISFPPGDAQNEVAMGGVFSTAMSVLILNAADSRLPVDEDYRVKPLF
ncbi:MAG TPA: prenyltransferase/squalene oxidase repeat-containing protein [Tepidisphaeraceae bacterium]|jgi:hypothetical protein|nr:prenyltransferase/squalene oxidase repeat-containing protein [Tepidisphaeraceae bacterium]